MRGISLNGAMRVVVITGVGLAALRDASEMWAGIVLTLVLLILGTAVFGAIYSRGRRRAGWLGFAVFGWGYFMLAFGPGFSSELGNRLPSTQLLIALHPRHTRRVAGCRRHYPPVCATSPDRRPNWAGTRRTEAG
jgi:hypothetical protein